MDLKEIYDRIVDKKGVGSHNLRSESKGDMYILYYYETPIMVCYHDKWFKNKRKYSNTTSKHQNAIDVLLLETTIDMDEYDLVEFINGEGIWNR